MSTIDSNAPAGFEPQPVSSRVFVRCYRHYGEAKRAYDRLRVVGHISDKRMTVVARGLEWREPLPAGRLLKLAAATGATVGAVVGLLLWMMGFTASGTEWASQTLLAAFAGVVVALLAAVVVARVRSERRGVAETGHVEPQQYDILVEEQLASVAREVLAAK